MYNTQALVGWFTESTGGLYTSRECGVVGGALHIKGVWCCGGALHVKGVWCQVVWAKGMKVHLSMLCTGVMNITQC